MNGAKTGRKAFLPVATAITAAAEMVCSVMPLVRRQPCYLKQSVCKIAEDEKVPVKHGYDDRPTTPLSVWS